MKIETLKERIEKANAKVEKKQNTIVKKTAQIEKKYTILVKRVPLRSRVFSPAVIIFRDYT